VTETHTYKLNTGPQILSGQQHRNWK